MRRGVGRRGLKKRIAQRKQREELGNELNQFCTDKSFDSTKLKGSNPFYTKPGDVTTDYLRFGTSHKETFSCQLSIIPDLSSEVNTCESRLYKKHI